MTQRPQVIVDPHFRAMGDIFSSEDALRLAGAVDVAWGRDEPMPVDAFREGAARHVRDRELRLAVRPRSRRGDQPAGDPHGLGRVAARARLRDLLRERDPRALGGAGVRRCRGRDGPRTCAVRRPGHRGRRSGDAVTGRALAERRRRPGHLPPLRQARRDRRLRQHRQEPQAAPRAVRLRRLRVRPLADRRLPAERAGRAGRARSAPRHLAGDLRPRRADDREPGPALTGAARAAGTRTRCSCSSAERTSSTSTR